MPFPDKDKCLATLKPFLSILAEIPRKALKAYQKDRLSKMTMNGRVKSNCIWGYMIYYARNAFGNDPRVQFVEHFGTVSIVIDGIAHRLLFRMKKSDRKGLSSNIQTKLSDAFHDHDQRQIFLLPEMDPDRIEIVYILDNLGVKVEDVRVIARYRKRKIWEHSIQPKAKIIKSPVTLLSPKGVPDRARVRGDLLKKDKKRQGE